MIVRITSKRQVTFPKRVMEKLHLKAGDTLELQETPEGYLIRPHRFDRNKLAPLRPLIEEEPGPPDLEKIRHGAAADPRVRD